jgi:hypothetical protein
MSQTIPSRVKLLNYGLITFLLVFPGLVLLYKWAV